jgi:hypothetical protein
VAAASSSLGEIDVRLIPELQAKVGRIAAENNSHAVE